MKNWISVLCAMAILVAPVAAYAESAVAPVQVLKKGYVDNTLQEPASVDWTTGNGRKDWSVKWAVDDNYAKKFVGMLSRGTSNLAFGWAEIITHPIRWSRNAPLGLGLISGLIMGPIMGVLRTASGALDVATFWVPFWHGVPLRKPALGLHDVRSYGVIEDAEAYHSATHRYFFNGNSDQY